MYDALHQWVSVAKVEGMRMCQAWSHLAWGSSTPAESWQRLVCFSTCRPCNELGNHL